MNWGHGITIALIAFMSYIAVMAVVLINKPTELVSPDYYKNEVVFEREITAQSNAIKNNSSLLINSGDKGLSIELKTNDIVNLLDVKLYRSNSKEDDISIASKGKNVFIESSKLKKGRYLLTADWRTENLNFQLRDTVWIP